MVELYDSMALLSSTSYGKAGEKYQTLLNATNQGGFTGADGVWYSFEDDASRQKYLDELVAAGGDYVSALTSHVELLREKMANSINAAFQESAKRATGKGLDYLDREWRYIQEDADKYLDTVEKTYRIENLELDVKEKINKLTNKSA